MNANEQRRQDITDAMRWRYVRDRLTYGRAGNDYGWHLTEIVSDRDSNGPDWAVDHAMLTDGIKPVYK